MAETDTDIDLNSEIARLRTQVAELEAQLVEVEDWANKAVAAAQDRLYWLDRWHIDLNRMMERPGAAELRAAMRGLRAVYRWLKRLKRRLLRSA
jgi:hypothetical protein